MQSNDTLCKRAPRRPSVERTCEICGTVFTAWASSARRFCSLPCSTEGRKTRITCSCTWCSNSFQVVPARILDGRGKFCSRTCADTYQRESRPVDLRLWERVNRNGPIPPHRLEYGPCWPWTGQINAAGYGRIYRHFPDAVLTHRLSWELATGETLTSDDVIGHICDVRHCVRNDDEGTYTVNGIVLPRRGHLFKGAHINNWDDMHEKGRHQFVLGQYVKRGEAHPSAKLTADKVKEIRELYAQGDISQEGISALFNLNQTTVSRIVLRQTWKHVE